MFTQRTHFLRLYTKNNLLSLKIFDFRKNLFLFYKYYSNDSEIVTRISLSSVARTSCSILASNDKKSPVISS